MEQRDRSHSSVFRSSLSVLVLLPFVSVGTGEFYVNGIRYVDYFPEMEHRWAVCAPFFYTGTLMDFDMIAVVRGGGHSGQSGAIKHAAAKALQNYNRKKYRPILKKSQNDSAHTHATEQSATTGQSDRLGRCLSPSRSFPISHPLPFAACRRALSLRNAMRRADLRLRIQSRARVRASHSSSARSVSLSLSEFLLSRDARVVERQKYGQFGARKKYTFVKR